MRSSDSMMVRRSRESHDIVAMVEGSPLDQVNGGYWLVSGTPQSLDEVYTNGTCELKWHYLSGIHRACIFYGDVVLYFSLDSMFGAEYMRTTTYDNDGTYVHMRQ